MSLPTTSFSFAEDEAWCFEKEIALAVSKGCFFVSPNRCPCRDLPDLETDEGTNHRRPKHEDDVFILVKEYISSVHLRQKPLLCAVAEDAPRWPLVAEGC